MIHSSRRCLGSPGAIRIFGRCSLPPFFGAIARWSLQGGVFLRYVLIVTPEQFYAVQDDQLIALELEQELPLEFLAAVPSQLDSLLSAPSITIGGWDSGAEGPMALALTSSGQLISVIAVNPTQLDTLGETLTSIDYWLSTMGLRELSELSGNNVEFYEGLLELSPDASIMVSPRRKYVLVTGLAHLNLNEASRILPDAEFEVRYLDVLQVPSGPSIIRQRTSTADNPLLIATPEAPEQIADFAPVDIPRVSVAPAPEIPDEIAPLDSEPAEAEGLMTQPMIDPEPSLDRGPAFVPDAPTVTSIEPVDVSPDEPARESSVIDLTEPEEQQIITDRPSTASPEVRMDRFFSEVQPGRTYDLDVLPMLFDATGETLESISNEMFAVNDSIVVVVSLPEKRRDSPFEDRRKFRWDTSLDRIQLLNEHSFMPDGTKRVVHLFVESPRQAGYAAYVGELDRTAFQTQAGLNSETAWFAISPSLSSDLYRIFRKGRLPQHQRVTV